MIHDWMWHFGANNQDKKKADRVFLNNMERLIHAFTKVAILKSPRLWLAHQMYKAVKNHGGRWFWKGKNSDTEFKEEKLA